MAQEEAEEAERDMTNAAEEEAKWRSEVESLKNQIRDKKKEKAECRDYTTTSRPWYYLGFPKTTEHSREDERVLKQAEIDALEADLADAQNELSEARTTKNHEKQRMQEAKRKATLARNQASKWQRIQDQTKARLETCKNKQKEEHQKLNKAQEHLKQLEQKHDQINQKLMANTLNA